MDFKAINQQIRDHIGKVLAEIKALEDERARMKLEIEKQRKDLHIAIGQSKAIADIEPLFIKEIEEAKISDQPVESQGE